MVFLVSSVSSDRSVLCQSVPKETRRPIFGGHLFSLFLSFSPFLRFLFFSSLFLSVFSLGMPFFLPFSLFFCSKQMEFWTNGPGTFGPQTAWPHTVGHNCPPLKDKWFKAKMSMAQLTKNPFKTY